MRFSILNDGIEKTVESIGEGLTYMARDLKAMLALYNHETGLVFSMMVLTVGESMTLDDGNGKEIKVTRIN